jgi:regulator of protease activity HflC (stomatin/prohibitin superfamily)
MEPVMLFLYVVIALFVIGTVLKGFFQVRTAEAVVIQRMGKFNGVANAGINFKLPWLDQIAARIDLRVQQLALLRRFMRPFISWRIRSSRFLLTCST